MYFGLTGVLVSSVYGGYTLKMQVLEDVSLRDWVPWQTIGYSYFVFLLGFFDLGVILFIKEIFQLKTYHFDVVYRYEVEQLHRKTCD